MSRIIEHFLEKQLNEYRRKSKTILIVYKSRYDGLSKTRTHKKKKLSRNESKETKENNDANSSGRTIHCSEQNSSDILDTILNTWSSTLQTDISNFFEESSEKLNSKDSTDQILSPQECNTGNFPFDDPRIIKPVWYWNIETDNMKRRLDESCECSKKYKPKTPPLHLDTISRLRLQSFIRSLCEDKCNSRLCQPDEDTDKKSRCKRRKQKDKKGCKCKKDSSMVSFHITVPKQTKTVTLKNGDNTKSNKSQENSSETSKKNNESNKCRNCPYFAKNSDAQSEPSNQCCLISEPGDVTLKLGNQTITISVKRVNDNDQNESKPPGTNSSQRYQTPSSTGEGEQNRKSRNSISPSVNSYQESPQNTSGLRKNQPPNGRDKTCECLQRMKKSVEEDLKKYVLSQLNINDQTDSDPKTVQKSTKVKKCKYRNEESANSKKEEENQDLNARCTQSCKCGQSKKKKNSNTPMETEELEDDDVSAEDNFENSPIKKFARCVKICVEPQTGYEENSSEEQEEEYGDSKKQKRFGGTGGRKLCKHNVCPWRKKEETESENYQKKAPKKSSLKCQCNDGSEKLSNRNKKNKCCSCSSNTEKEEKNKCECPRSKKKQPKSEDKCCQCQPSQDKDTQVETNKSSEQNIEDPEGTEDTTIVNEDKVDEDNTQSKKNSVAETYSVKTENSSRKQSKASAVKESDLEKKDESCSCCICDEESSDEAETSADSEEEDEIPGSRRDSSRSQIQEEECNCDSSDEESTEEIRKKPILKNQKKSKNTRERPNSFSLKFCGDSDDEDIFHSSKPSRGTNKEIGRKLTSTEDLIECDCGEFEQLITELEEYCRTKCVNFKVSQSPGYYESEKKLYSGKSTAEESIFMVHKGSSCRFPSLQKPSILSKSLRSFSEKKALITSQATELIRRNRSSKICIPRSRAPRKTSSKLSDQRLTRRRKIEAHYKKSRMEEESNRCIANESYSSSAENSEIDYESSTSSVEEEKDACHLFGSNAVPRRIVKDKTRVIEDIDGTIFTKGRLRNEIRHRKDRPDKENQIEVNLDKSICLVPALLDNVELMSHSTYKRKKDYNPNSLMTRTNQRKLDPTIPSSLQGRSEIYPRRSRVHQDQEFSFHKNFRRKHRDREEMNEQLFTRVEKSSERLVRSIIVRNIESVRRIGAADPKLIVRIFEKYLSDVLDCNAKLLLGRKNLGLISHEDYLLDSSTRFQDPNFAYYFNIENPFSFLLYPSLVEGCAHKNKCGDEQNPGDDRVRCNCKQKGACCHCQAPKLPPTTDVQKKCSCMKDEKTCDCYKALQKMPTNPKPLCGLSEMKMSGGCACNQPMSVQKSIEQALQQDDTCKIKPMASSLISGNDMRMKRRCECSKKNSTMQTIGEGGANTKCCSCSKKSKKRRKSRSRSRSKSHGTKSKSKKHKCDCTEICEPKAPITAEGDHQPKKNSCECVPDLKIHEETVRKPSCSATKQDSPAKPRCPCPCRELLKMKPVKEGYISADPYGQKEDKRLCVCQPNPQPTQDESEEKTDQQPMIQSSCGICGVPEDTNKGPHKCNICQLVEGLGTGPDESMSMSTFASSDFEKIAGILKDTRDEILNQQNDDNKLISNIKCFRNSSGIICQSELVGCPGTCDKSGKSKTNTIEIRIKYPTRKTDKTKEKTCVTTCTNTERSRSTEKNRIEDGNYCEFVKILQQHMSTCFAKPAKSDLSMLLDSFARKGSGVCQVTQCVRSDPKVNVASDRGGPCAVPEKCDRKSSCLKTRASEGTRTCSLMQDPTLLCEEQVIAPADNLKAEGRAVCALKLDSISCQTSTCEAASESEKKDVKCLFRRERKMEPPPDGDDFTCPKRKSSDSLEAWGLEEEKEEIQIGSCSKESCMRIVERPSYMVKKQRSVIECDVRGSCVRQKIFEKLFPNQKQPCRIPSKKSVPCEPPTRKKMPCELESESPKEDKINPQQGNKAAASKDSKKSIPTSKNSSKTKNVASKSSSKNISQGKPPCSKEYLRPKKRDTMKLDRFDQNILAHALDTFLSKGR